MKKNELKIVVITTPIRPVPTDFPPIGALSVITALKTAGYTSTKFYDIDRLRPSYDDAINHIINLKPDILGISAVVSTAYEYTKKLSLDIKNSFLLCLFVLRTCLFLYQHYFIKLKTLLN